MNWKLFATAILAAAMVGCSRSSTTYSSTLAEERARAQAVRDAKSEEEEYQNGRNKIMQPYTDRSLEMMRESTANMSNPKYSLEDIKKLQNEMDTKMEADLKAYDEKWKREHPL